MTATIVSVLLPLALLLIMLYLGMTLRVDDFRAVARRPRALATGLAGQLLVVPATALLLAYVAVRGGGLDATMAVGLMVLAACPGGVSSGLLTHLARGDVALSIALTAISSVIAMLTMPLVLDGALRLFMESALHTAMPLAGTVTRIFMLTTLPVLAGMALRARWPQAMQHIEPIAGRVATLLFVLIVLATFWSQRQVLVDHLATLGPVCLLLNALAIGWGWTGGRVAGLSRRDRIAVATECGLHNSALGIYVTVELLRQPAMSVPSVVYALLMNVGAITFVLLMRRRAQATGAKPTSAAC